MSLPALDLDYLRSTLNRLLATPSPVGDTEKGTVLCRELICEFAPQSLEVSRKGVLSACFAGAGNQEPRAVTAHIDTLGALVKAIKANGRLEMVELGNYSWNSIENESVTVFTAQGQTVRGSVVISNASHHLYTSGDGNSEVPREQRTMEVRLDARVGSQQEVRDLGIAVGDVIAFDPRTEWHDGFVRSRFLDDKALVACLFTALKALRDARTVPTQTTMVVITNYEEVGHGGATGFPGDLAELLALDVAPVGAGQNCDEFSVAICAHDSRGPYDLKLRRKLERLAREHDIAAHTDLFPEYQSDVCPYRESGGEARTALIGPGVEATHGVERTHLDALQATTQLLLAFLLAP